MKKARRDDKPLAKDADGPRTVHVQDLMAERVVLLTRGRTVGHARRLMGELGIHCVPIANAEGEVEGILTSHDLIEAVQDETLVGQVMTKSVQTVARYAAPHVAARLMRKHHIHHLVVTHEQMIVGVISSFDLLQLVEKKRFVPKNLASKKRS